MIKFQPLLYKFVTLSSCTLISQISIRYFFLTALSSSFGDESYENYNLKMVKIGYVPRHLPHSSELIGEVLQQSRDVEVLELFLGDQQRLDLLANNIHKYTSKSLPQ